MGDKEGLEAGSNSAQHGFCPLSMGRNLVIGLKNFRGDWKMWSSFIYYFKNTFYSLIYLWLHWVLEKAMAPHSSTHAWKIPWTEEPGRLQSMGLQRVRHDWATSLSLSCIGEGNGNPLQCSCLENPRDGGAWWAAVYGVAQSDTTEAT